MIINDIGRLEYISALYSRELLTIIHSESSEHARYLKEANERTYASLSMSNQNIERSRDKRHAREIIDESEREGFLYSVT